MYARDLSRDDVHAVEEVHEPDRESVGLAMLVVLETLAPAERLAFVLHDMFSVPFEEIATIVGRSPAATRQLASRARRRVQGTPSTPASDIGHKREIVDAFLSASRSGDFEALMRVLDPDVIVRSDPFVARSTQPSVTRGAEIVAKRVIRGGARAARVALIDGAVGAVVAPRGRLLLVLLYSIEGDKVVEIDAVGDPSVLREMSFGLLSTDA